MMDQKGHFTVEAIFILGVFLVLGTFITQIFKKEWDGAKCSTLAFQSARRELIQTRQKVVVSKTCGDAKTSITLLPLEEMKDPAMMLFLNDASEMKQVLSQSWAAFSSLQSSVPESD